MTDSVTVFPPGFRVTDSNVNPVSGAVGRFYNAGTTTPKTVYSNSTLTTAIGTTVTTDAAGMITSGGNTALVYVGTDAYKVVFEDAAGVPIPGFSFDDVKGAVAAGDESAGVWSIPLTSAGASTYTMQATDHGKAKEFDVTSTNTVVVLRQAIDAGSGATFTVIRKGSGSNTLTIVTAGSDTINGAGSITLSSDQDSVTLASNGADAWKRVAFSRVGLSSGAITSDQLDVRVVAGLAAVGDVKLVPYETVPSGWLECNGTAVSRTTYSDLFDAIGITHGQGDGATTFNLPDYRGRFLRVWDHGANRDPNAAAISITGAANNGSGLIRLTVASNTVLKTGMSVAVSGVGGVTNANGTFTITRISSTSIDLQSSTFSGTYTSGGSIAARTAMATGGQTGDHVGSVQGHATEDHTHTVSGGGADTSVSSASPLNISKTSTTTQTTSSPSGNIAAETRPINAYLMAIILADPAAAAGAAGALNTIHTTSGTPSSGLGIDGDYAIDPAAKNIYGPKASGAWPSAVSLAGASYNGTSTTSLAIGSSGSKTLTTQAGLGYTAGARVRVADQAAPSTNYMEGVVTAYNISTGSLTFTSDHAAGSGTIAAWNLNIAGDRGATGTAATVAVGTTTTGSAGSSASVTNSGSSSAATFDFTIPRGDTGLTGGTGAAAPLSLDMTWSTGTSGDPGSGATGIDNATYASMTAWRVSETDRLGSNKAALIASFDDSTSSNRARVDIVDVLDNTKWLSFYVTSAITDSGGYDSFSATYIGTGTALTNGNRVSVIVTPIGNKGTDGLGAGDVVGPASATNNSLARFDGPTGKLLKDGAVIGTDVAPATSGTSLLKGNGSGGFSNAAEGTDYYGPGGTDVAVADGGTGASTAGGARTNLGLGTISTLDEATAAQFQGNTSGKALSTDKVWSAAGTVALTDGGTITPDFSAGFNFTVTLGGNRTLANPSNMKVGQAGFIRISQDGTGSRTLAYGVNWKFASGTAPVLTTTANKVDVLFYQVTGSSEVVASLVKAVV